MCVIRLSVCIFCVRIDAYLAVVQMLVVCHDTDDGQRQRTTGGEEDVRMTGGTGRQIPLAEHLGTDDLRGADGQRILVDQAGGRRL